MKHTPTGKWEISMRCRGE